VGQMAADIEHTEPHGDVGYGVQYSGPDLYQINQDQHGLAYRLLTDGWVPGMEPPANQLLGLPIHRGSPFVAFTEHGIHLTGATYYPKYRP